LLQEYQRLHPGLQLQVSVVDEAHLEETLRRDRSRGLGPDLLEPALEDRVTTDAGVAGLPAFNILTLACFNRQVVPRPPASLDALTGLAASGRPIGVAVDPIGIWWTAGALGAQDAHRERPLAADRRIGATR